MDTGGEERVDEGFTRQEEDTRLEMIKKPTSSIADDTPAWSSVECRLVAIIACKVNETDVSLLNERGVLEEAVDDGCERDLTEVAVCLEGRVFAGIFGGLLFGVGLVGVHDAPDRNGAVVEGCTMSSRFRLS